MDVDKAQNGIVTRGVLLDITKVRGVPWLEAGEGVFTEDLEAAEEAQGVRLEEGDALMLRLGWYKRRLELGPPQAGRPGLHAETLPWLKERGIALVGGDASQDAEPSGYPNVGLPIHKVGIVGMGLWLIGRGQLRGIGRGLRAAQPLGVHVQRGAPPLQERHRLSGQSTGYVLGGCADDYADRHTAGEYAAGPGRHSHRGGQPHWHGPVHHHRLGTGRGAGGDAGHQRGLAGRNGQRHEGIGG